MNKLVSRFRASVPLVAVFIMVTGYVFLNARNDTYADFFLVILAATSLVGFTAGGPNDCKIRQNASIFLSIYLLFGIISIFAPPSEHANLGWLMQSSYRLLCIFIVFIALVPSSADNRRVLQLLFPILVVCLATSILVTSHGLIDKNDFAGITPWHIVDTIGNRKYFSFYLLFLMWGAVSFLWPLGSGYKWLAWFCIFISGAALFSSTSESSWLAWVVSLFVFAVTQLRSAKGRFWPYFFIFILFFLIPLGWTLSAPLLDENPWVYYEDDTTFLGNYWSIGSRLYLYDFSAELVRKMFIFGHGFGSTWTIPIPSGELPGWSIFPGGHPHNIVFLILIDHGILGFLWLTLMAVLLFKYLHDNIGDAPQGPAVWALTMSGLILFSLSFSVWHPDVALTYGMFFLILFLSVTLPTSKDRQGE